MDRPETIRLLRQAHNEIVALRRTIDALEPKAHAYDTLAQAMRLSMPREGGGTYGVDIAWELKQAVDELIAEREKEDAPQAVAQPDAPDPKSDPVLVRRKPGPKPRGTKAGA